ncbi:hypothetical protein K438DRAFT_1777022 [Mycena galopus ATCC 62051]|nr:hypothetical protein K438DRAFT_1777022 [Mycena galopus ATCC 62051]
MLTHEYLEKKVAAVASESPDVKEQQGEECGQKKGLLRSFEETQGAAGLGGKADDLHAMWTDVPVALGPDLSLCAVSMESFALCKVWEWDLSYECLTSLHICKRLRDEESQNTEFWQELQASRARRGLPPGTKFAEDDEAQLDNEEGPDDSDVLVAAVIADVANKRKGRVARKPDSEGGGLRSAGLAEDLEAGAEPAAEDLEADSEAGPGADKEEGRGRRTRKRNRRYLGWLWHDDEDVEEHKQVNMLDGTRITSTASLVIFLSSEPENLTSGISDASVTSGKKVHTRSSHMTLAATQCRIGSGNWFSVVSIQLVRAAHSGLDLNGHNTEFLNTPLSVPLFHASAKGRGKQPIRLEEYCGTVRLRPFQVVQNPEEQFNMVFKSLLQVFRKGVLVEPLLV